MRQLIPTGGDGPLALCPSQRSATTALVALLLGQMAGAQAAPPLPAANQLPTGGTVVAGSAQVASSASTLTVTQSSQRAAIDWATFNVGSNAQVNFVQPGAASVTLNRVLDANPSQIFGRITAPGQVFLSNPNGVYFAPGASVDVGALLATTHSISNADFMAGNHRWTRNGATGTVQNDGTLSAALGGYIALLAPTVRNQGVVVANLGTVALAAGEAYTLQFGAGGKLTSIEVAPATLAALVENGNAVHAPGGLIILSAQAADHLQGGVVNNTGLLQASGLVQDGGRVVLSASGRISHSGRIEANAATNSAGQGGTVTLIASLANPDSVTSVDGSISVRGGGLGGDGGFVETSGSRVRFGDQLRISTLADASHGGLNGNWLIDPTDFTVAASGGDITGALLSSQLAGGNVTLQSSGGLGGSSGAVNVNDTVSWSANTLTLNAQSSISVNAAMNGSATAQLALEYGQGALASGNAATYNVNAAIGLAAGQNFSTKLGSDGAVKTYSVITSLGAQGSTTGLDLQGMNGNLAGNYVLGADISGSASSGWNFNAGEGNFRGFAPIGNNSSTPFVGTFDGLGHTVGDLWIKRIANDQVGLFGYVSTGAVIRNVGITSGTFVGNVNVGPLVGVLGGGSVSNSFSTVDSSALVVGGLVGRLDGGSISSSHASGAVSGTDAGGLVGYFNAGAISNSYATGAVSTTAGASAGGGLVGYFGSGSITASYATGAISGAGVGGGLVGAASGDISNSYASGAVSSTGANQGGLVGSLQNNGTISNSYATGSVTGGANRGGLVGGTPNIQYTVSDSYATGVVSGVGATNWGGLVGNLASANSFTRSYWNISNTAQSPAGIGLTTSQMQNLTSFAGWSISDTGAQNTTWRIYEGLSAPLLRGFLTSLSSDKSTVYNGAVQFGAGAGLANVFGSVGSGSNVGSYLSGTLYSNQAGYDISGTGTLTITKAPLGVTGNSLVTTYNGATQSVGGFSVAGLQGADTVGNLTGISATGASGLNAGSYVNAVSAAAQTNYTVSTTNGALTIGKANATVTANSDLTKTYNGAVQTVSGFTASGLQGSDTAASLVGVSATGSGTNAGSYATAASGTDANYNLNFVNGSLVIAKAALSVTGNSASPVYNGLTQSVSGYTVSGLQGSDTTASLVGVSATGASGKNANNYVNTVSAGVQANYTVSTTNGTLAIRKASLTVTANSLASTYNGATQSVSGFFATGLKGSDTIANLTGVSVSGASGLNAGSYVSTIGGNDANYNLITVNGALTIAKASLTITGNSLATTYNGAPQSVSGYSVSGLQGSDTAASLTGVSATGASATNSGSYVNTASAPAQTNYTVSTANGALTIAKANATVTANSDISKTYNGATQSVSGFSATGLVGGETVAVLSGVSAGGSGKDAGTYATTASGTDTNYNLSFVNGSLVISKANATVTANSDLSKTYNGATQSVSGFTATGLVGGETTAVLTGVSAAGSGKDAGTYATTASGTDVNYNLSFVNGSLVISKANATVTANSDLSKTYNGATQSVSGFSATGLVGGETTAVLSGVSAGGSGKNAGTYATTASGTDVNYNLSFVNGLLVISKANATVTANSDISKTYNGSTQSVSGFTATGLVGGETTAVLTGVSAAGSSKDAGTYATTASGTDTNYNLSFVNGSLVISKANATVTANSDLSKTYNGTTQSVSGFTATGLVGGETIAVLSGVSAGGSGKNAGTYATTASGTDANYNLSFVNGSLSIAKAPLSVTANAVTKTYDGSASASGAATVGALAGASAGDFVGSAGLQTYGDANAGTHKTVSASGVVVRNSGNVDVTSNYNLLYVDSAAGTIAKADYTGITGAKVYDGNADFNGVAVLGVNGERFAAATALADGSQPGIASRFISAGAINGEGAASTGNYNPLTPTQLVQLGAANRATILAAPRIEEQAITADPVPLPSLPGVLPPASLPFELPQLRLTVPTTAWGAVLYDERDEATLNSNTPGTTQ